MVCLARSTVLTPRCREGQAPSSVSAGIAGSAAGVVVAVMILGASHTYLDADIRVAAGSGGIAVIVELPLICAQHGSDGALATVLADAAVDAWRGTVGVGIRFAGGTLHTLAHEISGRSLPVLTRQACCAWCGRTRIAINLASSTNSTLCLATSRVRACFTVHAPRSWIGVGVSSASRAEAA